MYGDEETPRDRIFRRSRELLAAEVDKYLSTMIMCSECGTIKRDLRRLLRPIAGVAQNGAGDPFALSHIGQDCCGDMLVAQAVARAKKGVLTAVWAGSDAYKILVRNGFRTHHTDGQIVYLERRLVAP